MNKIRLKGRLGKEFGELWELDVKTPQEALLAINVNTEGRFLRYLTETSQKGVSYALMVGNIVINNKIEHEAVFTGPCGKEDIVITPVIGGAYGTTSFWVNLIVSVVLAVVSSMLAPSPNVNLGDNSDTARKDSYLFSGGPQPAKQGKPVPLGYGRMIIYPTPISVQYEYNNVSNGVYYSGPIAEEATSGFRLKRWFK